MRDFLRAVKNLRTDVVVLGGVHPSTLYSQLFRHFYPYVDFIFDICARFTDRLTSGAYCCVGLPGESDATVQETVDTMNAHIRSTHGPSASMLYILPGTKVYEDLLRKGKVKESVWIKSAAVYYTPEYSIVTLNRWRKQINRSGIRLPSKAPGFWDCLCNPDEVPERAFRHRANKFWKSTKRNINLLHHRY